jgi:pimeloyl-ACP methyl ester carboxylesterase
MSLLFAATFPDQVRSLVLYGTAARFMQDPPDFPWGWATDRLDWMVEMFDNHWGEGISAVGLFGEAADMPGVREMMADTNEPAPARPWRQ